MSDDIISRKTTYTYNKNGLLATETVAPDNAAFLTV